MRLAYHEFLAANGSSMRSNAFIDRARGIYCLTIFQANTVASPHSKRRWLEGQTL
jgi:hypothetical protein